MKFEAIHDNRRAYPVGWMCQVFGVSTSGYYEWRAMAPRRALAEAERARLERTIEAVHLGSHRNYGSPRIAPFVQGHGHDVSKSTVARRMHDCSLRSRLKRKFKVTTTSNHKLPVAPNHLMQDFRAYRPNQIWMSDISYVPTREGWLYVCAVIDLYSRRIVGFAASQRMTVDLVIQAFLRAWYLRRPGKWLIFHSDRGSQYACRQFVTMLQSRGIIQSMSRRANCWDSAPIESLWARMKTECTYWYSFKTREEAYEAIRAWCDEYNRDRAHSALENSSPCAFEKREVTRDIKLG